MDSQQFYSHGKLLLTAEYLVLDGALALAIPTKLGQHLQVTPISESKINWKSLDEHGTLWFETEFSLDTLSKPLLEINSVETRLIQIFQAIQELHPIFFKTHGYNITTKLEFPKNWGLGTSSTLIYNLAQWAKVNPYKLLELTFGGSGYDIACAGSELALQYQIKDKTPVVETVHFNPGFSAQLYFVHLNQKQNSRDAIANYRNKTISHNLIQQASMLTKAFTACETLAEFMSLIDTHEQLLSSILEQVPVKEKLFNDFQGSIKSLGAWGGDFVLVACNEDPRIYFHSKGYNTVIPFTEMAL